MRAVEHDEPVRLTCFVQTAVEPLAVMKKHILLPCEKNHFLRCVTRLLLFAQHG